MWTRRKDNGERVIKFFRLILSGRSLESLMIFNFKLMQIHKYSLTELEHMIPWERDIYLDLLQAHIKEINEQREQQRRHA